MTFNRKYNILIIPTMAVFQLPNIYYVLAFCCFIAVNWDLHFLLEATLFFERLDYFLFLFIFFCNANCSTVWCNHYWSDYQLLYCLGVRISVISFNQIMYCISWYYDNHVYTSYRLYTLSRWRTRYGICLVFMSLQIWQTTQ